MLVERVVVEGHLGVERDDVAALGDDQRVDLDHRRVGGDEGLVDLLHHLDGLVDVGRERGRCRTRAGAPGRR